MCMILARSCMIFLRGMAMLVPTWSFALFLVMQLLARITEASPQVE